MACSNTFPKICKFVYQDSRKLVHAYVVWFLSDCPVGM
jgi:hypothetical protein